MKTRGSKVKSHVLLVLRKSKIYQNASTAVSELALGLQLVFLKK